MDSTPTLPAAGERDPVTRAVQAGCIAGAAALLAIHAVRLVLISPALAPWTAAALPLAILAADLASGLVHWGADTWGCPSTPVIGHRFLRPFRLHHTDPDDLLSRPFVDCNGDVALLTLPLLAGALGFPPHGGGAIASVLVLAFAAAALPTNQVHQWAHQPAPSPPVRWLQDRHLILGREDHARHHAGPHTGSYCILTGWCNGPLSRMRFFERAEALITRLTGCPPRADAGAS